MLTSSHSSKYFNIVTHSPTPISIFRGIEWREDPLKEKYPRERFLILREPFDCFYDVKTIKMYPDVSRRYEYVKEGANLCRELRQSISSFPSYEDAKRRINMEESLRILKTITSFREFDEKYRNPLLTLLDQTRKKDIESLKGEIYEKTYKDLVDREGVVENLEEVYATFKSEVREVYEMVSEFLEGKGWLKDLPNIKDVDDWIKKIPRKKHIIPEIPEKCYTAKEAIKYFNTVASYVEKSHPPSLIQKKNKSIHDYYLEARKAIDEGTYPLRSKE